MVDDSEVLDAFRSEIRPGDIVWDVGAYEGRYVDIAVDEGARVVVAFEPRKETWEELVEKHAEDPVDVIRVALWDEVLPGVTEDNEGGPSTARFIPDLDSEVWAFPADRLMADLGPPDVVKIDVEGAEVRVLRGASALLREARTVLVEVHHDPTATTSVHDYGNRPEEVREILRVASYAVDSFADNGRTYHVLARAEPE